MSKFSQWLHSDLFTVKNINLWLAVRVFVVGVVTFFTLLCLRCNELMESRDPTAVPAKAAQQATLSEAAQQKLVLLSPDGTEAACVVNVTDADLVYLRELPRLWKLSLHGCRQLTDAGLVSLKAFPALRSLNLESCEQFSSGAIRELQEALPGCQIKKPLVTTEPALRLR